MTDAQRAVRDDIVAGPRGSLRGPFNAWLYSPDLAKHAQRVGEYARFNSALAPHLSELAICMVGAFWKAEFEWWAHSRMARDAGVPEAVLEAIRTGAVPALDDPEQQAVHDVAAEMLETRRLSDATYAGAEAVLGRQRLVDLVAIMGYYCMVSLTLNMADVATPDGSRAFD